MAVKYHDRPTDAWHTSDFLDIFIRVSKSNRQTIDPDICSDSVIRQWHSLNTGPNPWTVNYHRPWTKRADSVYVANPIKLDYRSLGIK